MTKNLLAESLKSPIKNKESQVWQYTVNKWTKNDNNDKNYQRKFYITVRNLTAFIQKIVYAYCLMLSKCSQEIFTVHYTISVDRIKSEKKQHKSKKLSKRDLYLQNIVWNRNKNQKIDSI